MQIVKASRNRLVACARSLAFAIGCGLACAVVSLFLALLAPGCKRGTQGSLADGTAARLRIAVVPKGTTHEFWKSVHAGAVKAAREFDVDIVWKGALREDDLKGQIDVVQSFVAQGVSGIVVAPLSDRGLVSAVKAANSAHIPVVVFDSDLASDEYVSFVATDNDAAGKMAGDALRARLLVARTAAKVVLLRYQEGSASTALRERGFLDAIRSHPELKLLSDSQYGGATTESAEKASENLLAAQKADSGNVQGIFAPNESTTFGMLLALRKAGLAGKLHFVGFDSSEKLVQAVRSAEIDALVVQRPFEMGYLAVRTMIAHLRGQSVDKRIDTGSTLVTRDNIDSPEIKTLVSPDLKLWLE
jgi:ribose transport system substrate-binding protein